MWTVSLSLTSHSVCSSSNEGRQNCEDLGLVFSLAFLRFANKEAGCALLVPQMPPTLHTMGGGWWSSEEGLGFPGHLGTVTVKWGFLGEY